MPFFYFADHDISGHKWFCVLKYGAKNTAWASPSVVCPQLRYLGPSCDDLEDHLQLAADTYISGERRKNDDRDETDPVTARRQWIKKKRADVAMAMGGATKADVALWNGMLSDGIGQMEPELAAESERIVNEGKVRFDSLRCRHTLTSSRDFP